MNKKLYKFILTIVAILFVSSCSKDRSVEDLLELVPADQDMVVVVKTKAILESAGGSMDDNKIQLPSTLSGFVDKKVKSALDEIEESGINTEAFVVTYNFDDDLGMIYLNIDDKGDFKKFIEDKDFSEDGDKDGFTLYSKTTYKSDYSSEYNEYTHIVLKKDYAIMIPGVSESQCSNPLSVVSKSVEKAKDKPFSETKFADYICSGSAAGAAVQVPSEVRKMIANSNRELADMFDGAVCFKADLNNNDMTIVCQITDNNGNPKSMKSLAGNMLDLDSKVSAQALNYLSPDEALVYAFSLKNVNWDEVFNKIENLPGMYYDSDTRMVMSMVKSIVEDIDGTVAFGYGPTNGLESIFAMENTNNPTELLNSNDFTLVIETKPGMARNFVDMVSSFVQTAGLKTRETINGFEINGDGLSFYLQAENDFIVASNHPIKNFGQNKVATATGLDRYFGGIALYLNKDNQLMRDLNLNYTVTASLVSNPASSEGILRLNIEGGKSSGILGKIIDMAIDVAMQSGRIENRYRDYRYSHSYYSNPYGYLLDDPFSEYTDTVPYYYDWDDAVEIDSVVAKEAYDFYDEW